MSQSYKICEQVDDVEIYCFVLTPLVEEDVDGRGPDEKDDTDDADLYQSDSPLINTDCSQKLDRFTVWQKSIFNSRLV